MDVAIVGGTGAEGSGLALRLAAAGHHVIIGSRDAARAVVSASAVDDRVGRSGAASGTGNVEAAGAADVVLLTVPFAAQAETLRAIAPAMRPGAVLCDASSPLATATGGAAWEVLRPWHGSAAEQAASIVGPGVRVVSAFQTIAAGELAAIDRAIDADVLVCGDDAQAKSIVGGLIDAIPGARWIDCGPLAQARIAEQLTALLISINRTYGRRGTGFRLTGSPRWGTAG